MNRDFFSKVREKISLWPAVIIGFLVIAIAGGAYYGTQTYKALEAEKFALSTDLEMEREAKYNLEQELEKRQEIIDSFQGQIQRIAGTVGTLEKLAATDPELLKKYSKVYFLNENYVPAKLSDIPKDHLVSTATNYLIHSDVLPHLERLIRGARDNGIEIRIASAFRSFDTQSALKSNYKVFYGSGANQFSADQGYSEHQLGTAVDFTTPALGVNFNNFASTDAYKWLLDNAHKYGFILSYPENNAYYKFEPWHWRFVGRALATDLHNQGKYFYDMDQREIDSYLVKLFD
jgi:LAS superfamily LD-carboxypeptidase LdcB